ncbi:MAG: hypothetical protein ACI9FG_001070, partial [Crocinitomicaceae bacterium]
PRLKFFPAPPTLVAGGAHKYYKDKTLRRYNSCKEKAFYFRVLTEP